MRGKMFFIAISSREILVGPVYQERHQSTHEESEYRRRDPSSEQGTQERSGHSDQSGRRTGDHCVHAVLTLVTEVRTDSRGNGGQETDDTDDEGLGQELLLGDDDA